MSDRDSLAAGARRLLELERLYREIDMENARVRELEDLKVGGAVRYAGAYLDTLAALEEARELLERIDRYASTDYGFHAPDENAILVALVRDFLARHPSPKETP